MDNSILNEVIDGLAANKGRWPEVAAGSGVPVSTVRKVAQRRTKNPRIETIDRLRRYFLSSSPPPASTGRPTESAGDITPA